MKFRKFKFNMGKGTANEADRLSRIVYITAICLLLGIVILAAFTTAANRARKPTDTTADSGTVDTPQSTNPPESSNVPEDTGVGESVPVLALPVDGKLGMKHDPEMQVKNLTTGDWRVHTGIDILCDEGAPVYAAADGTVSQVYEDPMMGYCVAIKHAGGYTTVYKNLSPVHAEGISEGSTIKSGQLIGTVGDSALIEIAEEAHLHFAVFLEDEELDPLDYLTASAVNRLEGEDKATE